jgi:internalin A
MIPEFKHEMWNDDVLDRTLAFLRQLWQGSRKLNEAKVILVGQGDVGKTSLVRRLRDDTFDPHESKTEGIAIHPWALPLNGERVQLNVWDFGGQEIMHATHQFFLTRRSLYLVVLDARGDEAANRLEYWLKIIARVAADAPVLVVGNQTDQHPLDLDQRGLLLKYPQIKAIIPTSCKTGAGIAELRGQIEREIGALKHVHDRIPEKWCDVMDQIAGWPEDFISHERWSEMCAAHDIGDEFVQAVLLRLLNDLGTVLSYHDDPRLADTNVLNPEWVTNGVYTLLNNQELLERRQGILSIGDLPRILSVHGKRYPAHRCHFITEMMEKFELCFRLDGDRERVLIPDLLPKAAPDTGAWDEALHFRYAYPVLPGSIMSRFIVRSQQAIEGELRWRSGVILRSGEGNRALVTADIESAQIDIHISGPPASRRRFLSAIRHSFEQIHNSLSGLKNEVRELVPLPDHPERLVEYEELLGLETMGEDRYVDGVLRKRFDLQQLLDGYESAKERRARQITGDYKDKPVEHLQDLIDIKIKLLQALEVQKASFGLHVPPHVVTELDQTTNEINYIESVIRERGGR